MQETVGRGGDCPVCAGRGTVELRLDYSRFCCYFVLLCRIGSASVCRACGSRMPAAALVNQPAFVSLVPTPCPRPQAAAPAPALAPALASAPEPAPSTL